MNKQIPYKFDCFSISPLTKISDSLENVGRMKVGVFTKYKNRNDSYITDSFAEQLIESAISCPIVGFYDREAQDWGGHLGSTLVSAYGYVENFVGWEPFTDSDGVVRDYAVFSVVVFSDYFEEARHILGKSQSMEINPDTIKGDWEVLGDEEYFVYTDGKMKGLCILGDSIEPCFSSSYFFEKHDNESQFDKFSSLLFKLKTQVEEAEKGGKTSMENFEEQNATEAQKEELAVETPATEPAVEPVEEPVEEPAAEPATEEPTPAPAPVLPTATVLEMEKNEEDFNLLTQENDQLRNTVAELNRTIEEYSANCLKLENDLTSIRSEVSNLKTALAEANSAIQTYQAKEAKLEEEKKNSLIQSYEKIIPEEEIKQISQEVSNFSYDELESKLAVIFARKNLNKQDSASKVFVAEEAKSPFEALISKYKKY